MNLVRTFFKSMKMNKGNIPAVLSFLLGLLSCNNVLYAFKVGNTYINIVFLLSFVMFVVFLAIRRPKLRRAVREIDKTLKLFVVMAVVSSISAIIVFASTPSLIMSMVNGFIELFLFATLYICVLFLKEHRKYIVSGIIVGVILNIILSIIQYQIYSGGGEFSLFQFFPQPSFVISSHWGGHEALYGEGASLIFQYRPQGFFLETSYYMALLSSGVALLLARLKFGPVKALVIFLLFLTLLLSISGNLIIVIMVILLYYAVIMVRKIKTRGLGDEKKRPRQRFWSILTTALIIVVPIFSLGAISNFMNENDVYKKLSQSISSANIADDNNAERSGNMAKSLSLVPQYPLGVGYNMSSRLLGREYGDDLKAHSAFNRLITIQLEVGFVGLILYIVYIVRMSVIPLLRERTKYGVALTISVLGLFVCQIGNGIGFFPFIVIILALANIQANQYKKEYNE